jgi:methionyl-tRNA formyltransferase
MMEGLFSRIIFQRILESNHAITGVVLPGRSTIVDANQTDNPLEVLNYESIASLCRHHQIPLYTIQTNHSDEYQTLLDKAEPDLVVAACFPFLLPAALYQYPSLGAYNLHPSLLPRYRGPVPLFWQFYFGDKNAGITLHEITREFDSGDIIAQQPVSLEDGMNSAEATALLAEAATKLLVQLIEDVAVKQPDSLPQPEEQASYYSWPALEQFVLSPEWHVMRAYNFICGTRHWKQDYHYHLRDKNIVIKNAHDYILENQEKPQQPSANMRWLGFQDGRLLVEL